jgi:carboxyl-terminal processing protease
MSPTLPELPASPYAVNFEQVWRIVLEKHFDPTLGCQDWPARRLEFGAKLADAKDQAAAYAVMNELLGTLKQSHFKAVPPTETGLARAGAGAGARADDRRQGGRGRRGGRRGRSAGCRAGRSSRRSRASRSRTSSPRRRARRWGPTRSRRRCTGPTASDAAGDVPRSGQGRRRGDARRAVRDADGELVTIGNLHDLPTTVSHRMMQRNKVGYLAFNYWMLPLVKRVEAAMTELRAQGMKGLVLDLRGNPGGVGAMSIPVARMLLTQPGSLGKLQFREFAQEFNVAGNADAFTGPVVVLVDEDTASTSEIFAVGLRDLGRVQIYGEGARRPGQRCRR